HWREAGGHHVVELQERHHSNPAVAVSRGVAPEHFPHAGRVELPRIDGVENPCAATRASIGLAASSGSALSALSVTFRFAVLIPLRPLSDQIGRNRLAHQWVVEPFGRSIRKDARRAIDPPEIWRDPG